MGDAQRTPLDDHIGTRPLVCWMEGQAMILDDANHPAVEGGVYHIAYGELVDGYRHAWFEDSPNPRKRRVRYSRDRNHPADSRCPECAAKP